MPESARPKSDAIQLSPVERLWVAVFLSRHLVGISYVKIGEDMNGTWVDSLKVLLIFRDWEAFKYSFSCCRSCCRRLPALN